MSGDQKQRSDTLGYSYELRITKTNKRKDNKTLYLVERLEQGAVVNSELSDRGRIRTRLLVEVGVPIHTNVRDFALLCEELGTPVFQVH